MEFWLQARSYDDYIFICNHLADNNVVTVAPRNREVFIGTITRAQYTQLYNALIKRIPSDIIRMVVNNVESTVINVECARTGMQYTTVNGCAR